MEQRLEAGVRMPHGRPVAWSPGREVAWSQCIKDGCLALWYYGNVRDYEGHSHTRTHVKFSTASPQPTYRSRRHCLHLRRPATEAKRRAQGWSRAHTVKVRCCSHIASVLVFLRGPSVRYIVSAEVAGEARPPRPARGLEGSRFKAHLLDAAGAPDSCRVLMRC